MAMHCSWGGSDRPLGKMSVSLGGWEGQPRKEMGPLSLDDIKTWLDKAMAGPRQRWGFPLGLDTFREFFQPKLLGISGELQLCSVFLLICNAGVMAGQPVGRERPCWTEPPCRALNRRQRFLRTHQQRASGIQMFWEKLHFAGRTEILLRLQQQRLASQLVPNSFSFLCFRYLLTMCSAHSAHSNSAYYLQCPSDPHLLCNHTAHLNQSPKQTKPISSANLLSAEIKAARYYLVVFSVDGQLLFPEAEAVCTGQ